MVESSNLEKKVLLSYVKHLRIEYLTKHTELTCEKAFIPLQNIVNNFENLSKMVGVQNSQETSMNLSKSNINIGAEMFLALNSCPSFYVKLYWKVLYGSEYRMAKFTLNIIRKAKDDFKVKAQKIFAKISSVLGFKHISYLHEGNVIIGSNNVLDIKGETHGKHFEYQNLYFHR